MSVGKYAFNMYDNKIPNRSKLTGQYTQKNRAEQTRILTFVAMVFYSLSTSICNWLVLRLHFAKIKHFAFFLFVTTNISVTRCSLWLAGGKLRHLFFVEKRFGEIPDKNSVSAVNEKHTLVFISERYFFHDSHILNKMSNLQLKLNWDTAYKI